MTTFLASENEDRKYRLVGKAKQRSPLPKIQRTENLVAVLVDGELEGPEDLATGFLLGLGIPPPAALRGGTVIQPPIHRAWDNP